LVTLKLFSPIPLEFYSLIKMALDVDLWCIYYFEHSFDFLNLRTFVKILDDFHPSP
jgi:hypothetical protein